MPFPTITPGFWFRVPNTKVNTVGVKPSPLPPVGFGGFDAVTSGWGSGCIDSARAKFYIHGGGHGDYAGNEVYQFDWESLLWSRLVGPTPNAQIPVTKFIASWTNTTPIEVATTVPHDFLNGWDVGVQNTPGINGFWPNIVVTGPSTFFLTGSVAQGGGIGGAFSTAGASSDAYADGNPASVHPYGMFQYLPNVDRVVRGSGSRWQDGIASRLSWRLNPELPNPTWTSEITFGQDLSRTSDFDILTAKLIRRGNGIYASYRESDGVIVNISAADGFNTEDGINTVIHQTRREVISVGLDGNFPFFPVLIMFNLNSGSGVAATKPSFSGDVSGMNSYAPGLAYDSSRERIMLFKVETAELFDIDMAAGIMTKVTPLGGEAPPAHTTVFNGGDSNGTYGRFRYLPTKDAFIYYGDVDEDVYLYKPTGVVQAAQNKVAWLRG